MLETVLYSLSAIAALLPACILPFKRPDTGRDAMYNIILLVAVIGPVSWAFARYTGTWSTGLSTTLWITIAASMVIFAISTLMTRESWRLTPLVSMYMVILGVLATIWSQAPETPMHGPLTTWVGIHIAVSVITYAFVTIGAISALAAFVQERALKTKKPTSLTRLLPSVTDCERLLVRFLAIGQVVLLMGLISGMAVDYTSTGMLLHVDHKTLLSILTFLLIGGLLIAHYRSGLRGRKATRIVLVAYLLLTLGYPGVKFVTDVVLG